MNPSVGGVTLYAAFIFAVLEQYKNARGIAAPLFEMTRGLDPSQPHAKVPLQLYNDVCDWIEANLGRASLRKAGQSAGSTVYAQLVREGTLGATPTPPRILSELQRVTPVMVQDPLGRGWEVLEQERQRVVMRRTQAFHCVLQEGVLLSLVERTGVPLADVRHLRCTRRGDAFCDYEVSWAEAFTPSI